MTEMSRPENTVDDMCKEGIASPFCDSVNLLGTKTTV